MSGEFLSWNRSGIHELGTGVREGGRHQALVELRLAALDSGESVGGQTPFELMGPLDVDGLLGDAVVARVPAPGCIDASETRLAHIELAPEDLPWRFTPERPDGEQRLQPWIVLVVAEATEATFLGDRVQLAAAALAQHNLADSGGWAHMHALGDGSRRLARIVSPRDLRPETDHVAVLVPSFAEAENAAGIGPAWDGAGPATLRWYDRWAFRTGPAGDFELIAARLQPTEAAEIGPTFGVAAVAHPQAPAPLPMRAALAAIPAAGAGQPDAAPPPAAVTARVAALSGPLAAGARWVLGLPAYDEPWSGPPAPWREAMGADPRRRGAAGLGAWAATAWQERIADAASAQAGALGAAAQRIRHLTFGLAAARSLWRRRVPEESDPIARLALLGPALARIPVEGGTTALDHLAGRVPGRLVPALFSSAARRALRPGPARSAQAAPGAGALVAVLGVANTCPPAPPPDRLAGAFRRALERGSLDVDLYDDFLAEARARVPAEQLERFDELIRSLPGWARYGSPMAPVDLVSALDPGDGRPPDLDAIERVWQQLREIPPFEHLSGVVEALRPIFGGGGGAPACEPFADLGALGSAIAAAVDPTTTRPPVVDRVLATIPQGLEEPLLAPPDLSPELDLPLWKFLDENERDWLLPGVGQLPADRVAMVQTNPAFVDAFLLGANRQALGELRWRNLPVRTGWTPLRRFWSRFPAPGMRNPAIEGVALWTPDSGLGDARHRTDPAHGEDLVVVFRTELFRRYPSTLVYLFPANLNGAGEPLWEGTPEPVEQRRLYPTFNGSIGPEVVFFGFAANPQQGRASWVVLEEPPPGFRFAPPAPAGANGAAFAATTFRKPVRVFLGDLL